jgi:hypothetical protein
MYKLGWKREAQPLCIIRCRVSACHISILPPILLSLIQEPRDREDVDEYESAKSRQADVEYIIIVSIMMSFGVTR